MPADDGPVAGINKTAGVIATAEAPTRDSGPCGPLEPVKPQCSPCTGLSPKTVRNVHVVMSKAVHDAVTRVLERQPDRARCGSQIAQAQRFPKGLDC
jgi:hypothetical protein